MRSTTYNYHFNRMRHVYLSLILVIFLSLSNSISAQQLAFPTAKGAGSYITGGRGGQVIHVTTLNPTGPGSLVEALQTPGTRQIVFDVGGTIDLRNTFGRFNFVMSQAIGAGTYDNVTINGQTAPGGITIESSWFGFNHVRNVIWRYVRFSHDQISGANDDIVTMNSREHIFDHCSFTHGNDEGVSVYGASLDLDIGNVTFQNNLFFNNKTGMIIGGTGDTGGFTVTQNLFVGTSHRFPNIGNKTDAHFDIINNIVYNFKSRWVSMGSDGNENASTSINFIGNYYKISSASRDPNIFGMSETYTHVNANQIQEYSLNPDNVEIYTGFNKLEEETPGSAIDSNGNDWNIPTDNDTYKWTNFNYSGWGAQWNYEPLVESPWFVNTQHELAGQPYPILSANQAYTDVIADVGANKYLGNNHNVIAYRTATDALAIDHIVNDSATDDAGHKDELAIFGEHVSNVTRPSNWDTDLDGMPDSWEISHFGDLSKDGTADSNADGYTDLEAYLNLIDGEIEIIDAEGVTVSPATATINIPDTVDLSVTFQPIYTTNQSGIWTSSDTNVATVNAAGIVTPVSEGEVIITFNSNDGGFSDSATITVTNIPIDVESVSLSPETLDLNIYTTATIVATILPANAWDQTGTWTSSDPSIATVNQEGFVEPTAVGETTISFTTNDGDFTASTIVTTNDNQFGTYEFYNADNDVLIELIEGGEVFDLDEIGENINFRVIPAGGDANTDVESVGVVWSGIENGAYGESAPIYAGMNQHAGNDFWAYTVQEGVYNFIVTYYSDNGQTGQTVAVDYFSIEFTRGFQVNASEDAFICIGDTAALTASSADSYVWSTGETSQTIAVTPDVTSTYTVTGTHSDGSTTQDSVIVSVNEIPTIQTIADQTICEGEAITLTASTSVGVIQWSNGTNATSITVNPSTTTTYTVTANNNGCISTDEVTVNVNPAPDLNVSNDVYIPLGQSTTLTISGGVNYEWSTGETSDSITVTPTVTTNYTVTGFNADNGCSDTVNVTVTVVEPVVANAGNDVEICEGESVTLTASGGDSYLWNNGATTQSITVNPLNTSNYTVTVSDQFTSDSDSVLVTVNPVPIVDAGNDVTINQGENVTLYASGGNTYLWSTGDTNPNISVSPSETTTYSVTTTINGCFDTDEVTVTVIQLINASAGEDRSICLGEQIVLNATGGDTYEWSNGETTQSITVSPDIDTTYTVTVTNQYGSDTDDVSVSINDDCPALDFEFLAYPNPTNGIINVSLAGLNSTSVIKVNDILGKQLKHLEVQPNSGQTINMMVDISGMTKGFYLLTFYGDNRVITKKMILR